MLKTFCTLFAAVFILSSIACFVAIIHGFPIHEFGVKFKNTKKLFLILCFSGLGWMLAHGEWRLRWNGFWSRLDHFASQKSAIFILFGAYSALFLWQQVSEYFAIKINFIPFGFYDYMFYHFWDSGKVNYTGLLHDYYHLNTILFLFSPLWKLFPTPILLIILYGPLVAAPAIPLYFWIRRMIPSLPWLALLTAAVYLNYRYLDNYLSMNFCVEAFYGVFILTAVYFGYAQKWAKFYLFIILGLLVKEDAFVYFALLGSIFLFSRKSFFHGLAAIFVSLLGALLVIKVFAPLTGNAIIAGSVENYSAHGGSITAVLKSVMFNPLQAFLIMFNDPQKIETYFSLFYRLLFIPLFSPAIVTVLGALFPLFLRVTGRDVDFYELNYQYAAAIVPFVFIAFGFGLKNLYAFLLRWNRLYLLPVIFSFLFIVNGSNYRSSAFTQDHKKSIEWARKIPDKPSLNFVTHGQLLPYTPYRQYNYYFAYFLENPVHPYHKPYSTAEYYLIDTSVNPYPVTPEWVEKKKNELVENPNYELKESDGTRFLFKRR